MGKQSLDLFMKMIATSKNENYLAIEYIKKLASRGKTIPKELLPYVVKACDKWVDETKGLRREGYEKSTKNRRILDIIKLISKHGYLVTEAIRKIAERDGLDAKSLSNQYYKSDEYKEYRKTREYPGIDLDFFNQETPEDVLSKKLENTRKKTTT